LSIAEGGLWIGFGQSPNLKPVPHSSNREAVHRADNMQDRHYVSRFPMQYGGNRAVLIIKFGFFDL
jgi:hypothetical protein